MSVSAAWLLRLSGWACVSLVLPLLVAFGEEADGRGQPAVPPLAKILTTLRPEHPRVMATSQTFETVRASVRGGGCRRGSTRKSRNPLIRRSLCPCPSTKSPTANGC